MFSSHYSNKDATCSCKLAILRPKKSDTEAVIAAFLKGKYGQAQIKRYTRGAVQMGLILEDTDQIIVPHFTDTLGKAIKQQIDLAYRIKEHSIQTYSEAQELLETHLGISKAEKCDLITSTETLLQSFKATGRLDAEYYQPQYRKLETALINYDPMDTCSLSFHSPDLSFNHASAASSPCSMAISTVRITIAKMCSDFSRRLNDEATFWSISVCTLSLI